MKAGSTRRIKDPLRGTGTRSCPSNPERLGSIPPSQNENMLRGAQGMQQSLALLVAMSVLSDGSTVHSRAQLWLQRPQSKFEMSSLQQETNEL